MTAIEHIKDNIDSVNDELELDSIIRIINRAILKKVYGINVGIDNSLMYDTRIYIPLHITNKSDLEKNTIDIIHTKFGSFDNYQLWKAYGYFAKFFGYKDNNTFYYNIESTVLLMKFILYILNGKILSKNDDIKFNDLSEFALNYKLKIKIYKNGKCTIDGLDKNQLDKIIDTLEILKEINKKVN